MDVVTQEKPLSMGWCLDCHRDPGSHLRPKDVAVTDMNWNRSKLSVDQSKQVAAMINLPQSEAQQLSETLKLSPEKSESAFGEAGEGLRHSRCRLHAELLHVSSINHHVTGLEYWRSLEQLAETPEVAEFLDKEFPGYDADTIATSSRRGFMKLMGAAMALAGVTLTRLPPLAQGRTGALLQQSARHHPRRARAIRHRPGNSAASATGLLVTSFDGRPDQDRRQSRSSLLRDRQGDKVRLGRRFRPGDTAGDVRSRPQPKVSDRPHRRAARATVIPTWDAFRPLPSRCWRREKRRAEPGSRF